MSERYGATPQEWEWAAYHFGADILPAVGDPDPSLPRTKGLTHLDSLAKTPSVIGANGVAHGVSGWVLHTATPEQILAWKQDPALNVLLNTRNIRAIDIDIDDVAAGDALEAYIVSMLGVKPPVRTRGNSGKRTILIRLDPNPVIRKRVIRVGGKGAIEFLANGQQTAVFGTHPSGARFTLRGADAGIPTVPIEAVAALWDALRSAYDEMAKPLIVEADAAAEFIVRNGGVNRDDPVLRFLDAEGWITGGEASGVAQVGDQVGEVCQQEGGQPRHEGVDRPFQQDVAEHRQHQADGDPAAIAVSGRGENPQQHRQHRQRLAQHAQGG